jgi:hypothetical protein
LTDQFEVLLLKLRKYNGMSSVKTVTVLMSVKPHRIQPTAVDTHKRRAPRGQMLMTCGRKCHLQEPLDWSIVIEVSVLTECSTLYLLDVSM